MNATDRLDHAALLALQNPDADQQVARRLVISEILEIEFHEAVRLLGVSVERAHAGRRRIVPHLDNRVFRRNFIASLDVSSTEEIQQLARTAMGMGYRPSPDILWRVGMPEDAERLVQERLESACLLRTLDLAEAMMIVGARRPAAACVNKATRTTGIEITDTWTANACLRVAELSRWLVPSKIAPVVEWTRQAERLAKGRVELFDLLQGFPDSVVGRCAKIWQAIGAQGAADRLMERVECAPNMTARDRCRAWLAYDPSSSRVRHWVGVVESEMSDDMRRVLEAAQLWGRTGVMSEALRCVSLAEDLVKRRDMGFTAIFECALARHPFDPQGAIETLNAAERDLDASISQPFSYEWQKMADAWCQFSDADRQERALDEAMKLAMEESQDQEMRFSSSFSSLAFSWSKLGHLDKALACAERAQVMLEAQRRNKEDQPPKTKIGMRSYMQRSDSQWRTLAALWREVGREDRRAECLVKDAHRQEE